MPGFPIRLYPFTVELVIWQDTKFQIKGEPYSCQQARATVSTLAASLNYTTQILLQKAQCKNNQKVIL